MKLLLHIGTEKTGTTSSQKWAASNRENLIKQGVFYSKVLGSISHVKIYLWALPPEKDNPGFAHINALTVDARRKFQADLPELLSKEVEEAKKLGCHTFLISNEHCHSHLRKEAEIRKLHGLLQPLFASIQVVCSFRPQVDLAVSFSSTVSRGFFRVGSSFFEAIKPSVPYYNYDRLEQRWSAVFGSESLDFFAFKKEPDTIAALSARLGLDVADFNTIQTFNEALDIQSIALTNALVDMPYKPSRELRKIIGAQMLCSTGGERVRIGLDFAEKIHAKFVESNAAFAARCPSISVEDLTPDWARFEAEQNLSQLDQPCSFSDKLGELMMRIDRQHISTTIALKLSETERALALRKPESADKFCTVAEALLQTLPDDTPSNRAQLEKNITRLRKAIVQQQV